MNDEEISSLKLLQIKINEILLREWDPIGIQDISQAQDEYEAYTLPVLKLIISGKTEEEIFDYLWWLETEHMCMPGIREHTKMIAKKLRALFESKN
jgi:hypothetical protein